MRRWFPYIAAPLILLLGLGLRIMDPSFVEDLRLSIFDNFQRLAPRPYTPVPVRIVDLDDETLKRTGQWPWPRTEVAKLVDKLRELGAATIAFDIVFAEPDRTSPRHILPLWKENAALPSLGGKEAALPDHDALLAAAMARGNTVSGFVLTPDTVTQMPAKKAGFAFGGDDPRLFVPGFTGAVTTLPVLEDAAAGNGSFNLVAERDGIVRRLPTLLRLEETLYPSLALEALRTAQGAKSYLVKSSGASGEISLDQQTGITQVKVGAFAIPTDANGRIWLHYTETVPDRFIPAWEILEGVADPDWVAGHIILIGTSAAGLKDQRATPLNPVAAGVETHAQAIEQILLGQFLERPDWATGAEIVYLLVLGLLLIFLLSRLGALWCAGLAVVFIGGPFALSWHAYSQWRWLLDPLYPAIVVLLIYIVQSLLNFLKNEAEKRQVRGAFSRYLAPALVERLAENPEALRLGGEMRDMTLLFCDIRGFTTISEQFDAEGLTQFINRFLTPMTDIILKAGGTIDKYMGDAIMAFWNAPLDDLAHAAHSCKAALAMQEELRHLNKKWKEEAEEAGRTHHTIEIGIGINSGTCCVGNMGSDQRFDYSVLGDDVNLASRLEGQSKTYGVGIVIGENTENQVREFATLELDLIRVKGKTKPVRIFALLGTPVFAEGEKFMELAARHAAMLEAYRAQDWQQTESLAAACAGLGAALAASGETGCCFPDDGLKALYRLYGERAALYAENPPVAPWDGVFTATSK